MSLKSKLYTFQHKGRQKIIGNYYGFLKPSQPPVNAETFQPKKVLFVFIGLIGDSVMTLPALIEARKIWGDAHFTVLVRKHNYDLLTACPLIDEFYECNADPLSLRKSDEIKELQKWLDSQNFDLAIILSGDQYAHLLAKANIPVRVGVKGTLLEKCLTHLYDIGSPRTWATNERLNALRCLGYKVGGGLPQLWIDEKSRVRAREKLSAFGLRENEEYAVLHPFGSTPNQWWQLENVAPLAQHLSGKYKLKTVLVGKKYGLNGFEVFPEFNEGDDNIVINTIDKLDLPELLAVIDDAGIVVTTDSGPYHIAGALKKPVVGLFRARRPEHAGHYPTADVILGADDSCQTACKWDYCQSNPCRQLSKISVEDVIKQVDGKMKISA